MRTAAAWSTSTDTRRVVTVAYQELLAKLEGPPDWLAVYASVKHDSQALVDTLNDVAPGVPFHGGTSCLGVMTEEGFHEADGAGLGLFGIQDPPGRYGVGAVPIEGHPQAAGMAATREALAAAGLSGPPSLIWLMASPGYEEDVLQGIQDVVGRDVPIAGGSSADNTVEGHWHQFAGGRTFTDGVVVTAMRPSTPVYSAFRSGYYPTEKRGVVTRASRRTIYAVDGRPAAQVYNAWTGGVIAHALDGGNVLGDTSLHPLGREVKQFGQVSFYRLSHPESVTEDGGLRLFTNVAEGDEVILMTGSRTSLVARAIVVAQSALRSGSLQADRLAGGLVIYCAGCMLTVQDSMADVAANVQKVLGGKPFLGAFTFGEQGCFLDDANYHGNLMISVVVFTA